MEGEITPMAIFGDVEGSALIVNCGSCFFCNRPAAEKARADAAK